MCRSFCYIFVPIRTLHSFRFNRKCWVLQKDNKWPINDIIDDKNILRRLIAIDVGIQTCSLTTFKSEVAQSYVRWLNVACTAFCVCKTWSFSLANAIMMVVCVSAPGHLQQACRFRPVDIVLVLLRAMFQCQYSYSIFQAPFWVLVCMTPYSHRLQCVT